MGMASRCDIQWGDVQELGHLGGGDALIAEPALEVHAHISECE